MDHTPKTMSKSADVLVMKVHPTDLKVSARSVWTEVYTITIRGREFALFKIGNGYLVIDRRCPHKQADLARFGYLKQDDGTVLCTAHAHEYNLATGRCLRADTCKLIMAYKAQTNATDGTIDIVVSTDSPNLSSWVGLS